MSEALSSEEAIWYERPTPTSTYSTLGMDAMTALVDLSEDAPIPSSGRRRWYVNDRQALSSCLLLDLDVRSKGIPTDAPDDARAELNGYLDEFYAALPFTEAERGVVRDAHLEADEDIRTHPEMSTRMRRQRIQEISVKMRRQQFEIVNAGLRTVVQGRDLMRRWWAWRRELEEYEGQGSLDQAKGALIDFAGRIVAPEHMPDVFYDVQGKERPVPYRR